MTELGPENASDLLRSQPFLVYERVVVPAHEVEISGIATRANAKGASKPMLLLGD
jgi:hypothetical protein